MYIYIYIYGNYIYINIQGFEYTNSYFRLPPGRVSLARLAI